MSEHLPIVSGKQLVRVLGRFGWEVQRQTGSHIILHKIGSAFTLAVPNHKTVSKGTLRSLLKDAEIEVHEFRKLL
jgi:predicted RNA binding protein YcfA (HicA-like mRNA interferase family)